MGIKWVNKCKTPRVVSGTHLEVNKYQGKNPLAVDLFTILYSLQFEF